MKSKRSNHSLEEQIRILSKFPDQNPNPVMRASYDRRLIYANPASSLIIQSWKIDVGSLFPKALQVHIKQALASPNHNAVEIKVGHKTFSFRLVPVHEFEFINIYGTDITAAKVLNKFPDQNPNPVMRVATDHRLIYANNASQFILETLGIQNGECFPSRIEDHIKQAVTTVALAPIEVKVGPRFYSLSVVPIPEFDFINVYCTNITSTKELEVANKENERLLLNILPRSIAERLKKGERVIADKMDEITIMFADIVGFTELSEKLPPKELVTLLNGVFSSFDQLVEINGLEKIKTIGDAYMVIGGMDLKQQGIFAIADMALEMQIKTPPINTDSLHPVVLRIGIHVGTVVAGVIGLKKFVYDVWGDAVNIASRMETHGVPGQIQVSKVAYELLKDRYILKERGTIEIKGKQPKQTYFLLGKKD
jgi:class 3 adenylate cyclase